MLGIQLGGIYPGLFTHTCATVTKQYNLVAVAGQCYPATGKVTVGLALQRHASQTWVVYPRTGSRLKYGRCAHHQHSSWTWYSLPYTSVTQ